MSFPGGFLSLRCHLSVTARMVTTMSPATTVEPHARICAGKVGDGARARKLPLALMKWSCSSERGGDWEVPCVAKEGHTGDRVESGVRRLCRDEVALASRHRGRRQKRLQASVVFVF